MMNMAGKVAMVTGASAGIGRETALALARAGAAVVLADVLEVEGARCAEGIEAGGGRAVFICTDVASEGDLQAAVQCALDHYGRLDIAVNNAGVEQSDHPIVDLTPQDVERLFAINIGGVLFGMKHEIRAMRGSGGGAIVNLSSIAGLIGFPGAGAYVASKHAVLGLTKTAALEHAKDNIRVNAVCPGAIQTAMIDRFVHEDARAKQQLIAQHPLGRIGQATEVADAILWLASDGAGFVTGEHLVVDGGYTVQ